MAYGHVTIERANANGWLGHCRVTFFGEDVTNRCVELDDEKGEIVLHVLGADGQPLMNEESDGLRLEKHRHAGTVTFQVLE